MKFQLKTKLSISYMVLDLLLVALISLLTNVFLERQFQHYIVQQQESQNRDIVNMIANQVDEGQDWDLAMIENIGVNALERGLIVRVMDRQGATVWDATEHNYGLCQQMMEHMAYNMTNRYPGFKGGYEVSSYPLRIGAEQVGTVEIGYYGPFFFTDNDLLFINTLNKLLAAVGLFSLLLALLAGTLTARWLSRPLAGAVETAREIGKGHYDKLINEYSNTMEIDELTSTINDLARNLEKQEQLRRRLTADMAHELRTPLATVQSHLEAMIDGVWEADAERLSGCHEEILRINRMVGDLEQLARYESENLILHKEELDLHELAEQVAYNCQVDFVKKGVALTVQGEPSRVAADRDKINQVLLNLLSNALKYTPEGGQVEVTVKSHGNNGVIKVKDNGAGIKDEDLPHVFERFYRADQSRNRETGGSGIGLAIAKAIVEAHGGRIRVISSAGEGSEFIVLL